MSNDRHDELDRTLLRLYGELGEQAGQLRPAPAAAIRERGDARHRARTTVAVAAALLVAAGVLGGARLLGSGEEQVVPAPQPRPVPSASPVRPTPNLATSSALPPVPASVSAQAFLDAADLGSQDDPVEFDGPTVRHLCGVDVQADPQARRSGSLVTRPGDVPLAVVQQEVAVLPSAARARAYLETLRTDVRECPPVETSQGGTVSFRLVDTPRLADETVLIRREEPSYDYETGVADPDTPLVHWVAAVRYGDSVTLISTNPYEVSSVDDPAVVQRLMRRAAERLAAWRG